MARRFHLPALGVLAAQLVTLATAVAQIPQLTATVIGKGAVAVLAVASVVGSLTKPIPKQKP